jgi:cytidylate kinase
VTVDGPSGAGKGTLSAALASKLGYSYLDSGALYRLLALASERHKVALDNQYALVVLAAHLDICFEYNAAEGRTQILLEGEDVSRQLRTESVAIMASELAVHVGVRAALVERQRLFALAPGLVADGRDMGTVVFPEARLKIYLTASAEERAARRYKQLLEKGDNVSLRAVRLQVDERDQRDTERQVAPLRPADDAIQIDTSEMSADAVLLQLLEITVVKGLLT